jgi:hypothetical protein
MLAKAPGPVMDTPTGFHPNGEWWYIRNKSQQFTARDALPEHHMPGVIHPDHVKDQLRDIDAEDADLLCHGTCLLSVNGWPKYRNHSGSSEPFWKEAGPLHLEL